MAAGASEVVRLSRRTGAVLCAVHFPAGEPRTHQKEDGRAFPCREPRGTGHPAAAGQGRRTGRLDDRRAAQAGLHRGESELRLPLRHGDGQGQGSRDAAGPRLAGRFSGRRLFGGGGAGLGQDPHRRPEAGGVCGSAGYLQSLSHLRADYPSPRDEAAVPGSGRPCRLCCGAAGVPDAGLLQRRCHDAGSASRAGSGVPAAVGHHGGAGAHRRPGPVPPCAGRRTGFQRGTARLLRRPLPRLHRGLRHGQLCRQPDESPLALPHPAVRWFRSFREAAAQGPGGLGV